MLRLMLFVKLWSPMEARPIMGAWISPDLGREGGEWRRSGVSRRSSRGHSIVWMSTVEAFGLCLGDSFLWTTTSTLSGACSMVRLASWWFVPMRQTSPIMTSWSPLFNRPELEAGEPRMRDLMKTYFRLVSLPPSIMIPSGAPPKRCSWKNKGALG